jgi:hypothetical protein
MRQCHTSSSQTTGRLPMQRSQTPHAVSSAKQRSSDWFGLHTALARSVVNAAVQSWAQTAHTDGNPAYCAMLDLLFSINPAPFQLL